MSHQPATHKSAKNYQPQKQHYRLYVVFFLTFAFFIVEVAGGILSNSLALLADAGHMLQDLVALGLAIIALWYAKKPKNQRHTFGYKRAEVLAAFVNGLSLFAVAIYIMFEAFNRINSPPDIETGLMFVIALIGLGINIFGLALLYQSRGENLNIKGAFLHVLSDTLGSIGVLIASILIVITNLSIFDIIISIFISILILLSSMRLLKESIHILMEANPINLDITKIEQTLCRIAGIIDVHDTHIWSLSSAQINFSSHIHIGTDTEPNKILKKVNKVLQEEYDIFHSTIQIEELEDVENCGKC